MPKNFLRTAMHAVLLTVLFVLLLWHSASPIVLVTADLGRHLKNGEVILHTGTVFNTNLYSYTQPDFPTINHHWGTGVVFYLIYSVFGFAGLSVFYLLLRAATYYVFYRLAARIAGWQSAVFGMMLALPLMTHRREIRPEGFSSLFAGIYLYALYKLRQREWSLGVVIGILAAVQLLWVNAHIFFFMGPLLIAIFGLEAWIRKDRDLLKSYGIVLVVVAAVCLINPLGVRGALEPFNILREYGYMLAENQTVFFMQQRFPHNPLYAHFGWVIGLGIVGVAAAIWKKAWRNCLWAAGVFLFFAALGIKAVRAIELFGLFFVPVAACLWSATTENFSVRLKKSLAGGMAWLTGIGLILCFALPNHYYAPSHHLGSLKPLASVGLAPGIENSARFFKATGIKGPVFNNYDLGGYLIFYLYPQEHVFVDNRPEAYPVSFFKDEYIPMQENEEAWRTADAKYHFNTIYFYRHDMTPWAQPFLINRVQDPQWAPVFVDGYTIILLRRNEQNKDVINRYEIPQNVFRITR